jgi:8-oxo-dGTP pyrophosphatase MutT (NUDIX family)
MSHHGVVRAAGGIPWRRSDDGVEVLLVHRPRQDDWSFPKGKLEPGESWEAAARREVHEETGLHVALGDELPGAAYIDRHGRPKTVRFWALTVQAEDPFDPDDEVDDRSWLPVPEAATRLSYDSDRRVLAALERLVDPGPA